MKKVTVRFEPDPALDHIDVVIRAPEKDAAVSELMEKLSEPPAALLSAFDRYDRPCTLFPNQIVLISVHGKRAEIHTEEGRYYTLQPLQSLEHGLDPETFLRISRFEIVNLRKVLRYDFSTVGVLKLELADGTETWASRRSIPLIRRRLMGKGV